MTEIHLIRMPVETRKLARWAAERGWTGRRGTSYDEGRALHHLVTEIWGQGALSCFRILVPPRSQLGCLYAYSRTSATHLHDTACTHAMPEHLEIAEIERLVGKVMPSSWQKGQRLGFDLRVRPIRRLGSDLKGPDATIQSGSEIDAFLLEALRNFPNARDGMTERGRSREEVYLDWITERLAPAATLERTASRLVRFHRMRAIRENQESEGPDATVKGHLTVTDSTAFSTLLARGIGRHRAYGYGMLLLRPPSPRVSKK